MKFFEKKQTDSITVKVKKLLRIGLVALQIIAPSLVRAQSDTASNDSENPRAFSKPYKEMNGLQIRPSNIPYKSSDEYFSNIPDRNILMPVSIWGQVRSPGIHYVPLGASLSETISAAGGPTPDASLPDVGIVRDKKVRYVDLVKGGSYPLQKKDTVIVESSIRRDIPIILGTVGTVISALTLYFVVRNSN